MDLIFVNRFFYPDHSATSQMLTDLAFFLAARGHRVRVIASRQGYDDPRRALPNSERVRGVEVFRVPSSRFGRGRLVGRAIDYLSFYVNGGRRLLQLARAGSVVVAMTDPPLLSVAITAVLRGRRVHLVSWKHDLFPEVAAALGVAGAGGGLGRWSARLRDWSLRRDRMSVAISEGMAARVRAAGVPLNRVRVIHNWADRATIQPIAPEANPLRRDWGLDGAFVVGYSGNLGRAHSYATVVEAASLLAAEPAGGGERPVVFLVIGAGHGFEALREEVRGRGLYGSFRFLDYQPREVLSRSLSAADVHWVSLRPALEGLIMPSKVYGIMAAGRPLLFVGAKDGEIARLLDRYDCGQGIVEGDAGGFVAAVRRLRDDAALCDRQGANARRLLEERFDERLALAQWEAALMACLEPEGCGGALLAD